MIARELQFVRQGDALVARSCIEGEYEVRAVDGRFRVELGVQNGRAGWGTGWAISLGHHDTQAQAIAACQAWEDTCVVRLLSIDALRALAGGPGEWGDMQRAAAVLLEREREREAAAGMVGVRG